MFSRVLRAVLFAVVLFVFTTAHAWTVRVEEQEIQNKLSATMPVEWRRLMGTIVLSEPLVRLSQDSNSLRFQTRVELRTVGGITRFGAVALTGSLEYQPSSYAFFLRNTQFESVEIEGMQEPSLGLARSLVEAGTKGFLQRTPVYVLKGETFKQGAAKAFLKSSAIDGGVLLLNFSLLD